MNETYGKFNSPDPEETARKRIELKSQPTPQIDFATLVSSVKQARARGPHYDSIWGVLEALVFEVDRLRNVVVEQAVQIAQLSKDKE